MTEFMELIYMGSYDDYKRCQEEIAEAFPEARFEDASDFIHTHRFEVVVPDIEREDFWKLAVKRGFARCCFGFEVTMRDKKTVWIIEKILHDIRVEKSAEMILEQGQQP